MSILGYQGPSRLVYRRNRLTLTSLSPDQAISGGTARINCFGTNFLPTCVLYYDGVAVPTEYVGPTLVTAVDIPVGAAGPHLMEVRDPATGRISGSLTFTAT